MPEDNPSQQEKDNVLEELIRREIQTMEIYLLAKATRTSTSLDEYISTRLLQGSTLDTIEKELLDDLNNNGRIFGEFRNAIRATSNGVINRSRDNAIFADDGLTIAEEKYTWVAVLINTCPDCLERHGMVKTWSQWEAEGLPRTGATVCNTNCHCALIPADVIAVEPINRSRK